jgi:hypothetical protein
LEGKTWARYASEQDARRAAQRLLQHGMLATVERLQ